MTPKTQTVSYLLFWNEKIDSRQLSKIDVDFPPITNHADILYKDNYILLFLMIYIFCLLLMQKLFVFFFSEIFFSILRVHFKTYKAFDDF